MTKLDNNVFISEVQRNLFCQKRASLKCHLFLFAYFSKYLKYKWKIKKK